MSLDSSNGPVRGVHRMSPHHPAHFEILRLEGDELDEPLAHLALLEREGQVLVRLGEGQLAKAKAYLVSEPTLAEAGMALGLGSAIELSASEELGGRLLISKSTYPGTKISNRPSPS